MLNRFKNTALMHQEWHNLLFLHWRIPDALIRESIPNELSIDHYDGSAWIGIIPFEMRKLRPSFLPAIAPISNFVEVNLRTYVRDRYQRCGVWFFSLDTQNPLGNWVARRFFHLNYRYALTDLKISDCIEGASITYGLKFTNPSYSKIENQSFVWSHGEDHFQPRDDAHSLEYFLTERYRLFSYNNRKKQLITGTLSHAAYQLNRPKLETYSTGLFASNRIQFDALAPESVLACHKSKVKVYPIESV